MRTVRITGDARKRRATEYPSVGEQLDAMMKLARALQLQGFVLPADTLAVLEQCEAVKRRLPKPSVRTPPA